jgi:hypothetical protein
MNEQFERLAEEAMIHIPGQTGLHTRKFSLEKFAELLVKECINCVDDLIEPDPYDESIEGLYQAHNRALKQAMSRISKHFGVEQ